MRVKEIIVDEMPSSCKQCSLVIRNKNDLICPIMCCLTSCIKRSNNCPLRLESEK